MSNENAYADHILFYKAGKVTEEFGTEGGCFISARKLLNEIEAKMKRNLNDDEYSSLASMQHFLHETIIADRKREDYEGTKYINDFKEFSRIFYMMSSIVDETRKESFDKAGLENLIDAESDILMNSFDDSDPILVFFYESLRFEFDYISHKYFSENSEYYEDYAEDCYEETAEDFAHDSTVGPNVQECGLPF